MAEKIIEIQTTVAEAGEVRVREMFERAGSRREIVLTFLAILELVKELAIRLVQTETFGEILLVKRVDAEEIGGSRKSEARSQEIEFL